MDESLLHVIGGNEYTTIQVTVTSAHTHLCYLIISYVNYSMILSDILIPDKKPRSKAQQYRNTTFRELKFCDTKIMKRQEEKLKLKSICLEPRHTKLPNAPKIIQHIFVILWLTNFL